MGVSKNDGTPKSSILIGFSIILTIHFGVPLFLETPIYTYPFLDILLRVSIPLANFIQTSSFGGSEYKMCVPDANSFRDCSGSNSFGGIESFWAIYNDLSRRLVTPNGGET